MDSRVLPSIRIKISKLNNVREIHVYRICLRCADKKNSHILSYIFHRLILGKMLSEYHWVEVLYVCGMVCKLEHVWLEE